MLQEKNLLLCVSGGIAAFKAAALTSKLVQEGANVRVIMTESAKEFITPLTFQALSRQPVYDCTFVEPNPEKIAHIDLADWADVVVVVPATANIMAKLASGIADDMLTTTLLATKAPIFIAPAMNVNMYNHPAVQKNMKILQEYGYVFIDSEDGFLACGWTGKGRLAEPEQIIHALNELFIPIDNVFEGKHIVITAGPTQENIDPVRFFTNYSSGKMGYALANAAKKKGAKVTLISGPVQLPPPVGVNVISILTAQEMYEAVLKIYDEADVVIKSAAVADYRPKEIFDQKRKKQPGVWKIEMERTIDILKTLGEKKNKQILVGFAAESEHLERYALEKLEKKNLDLIVANNISVEGAGFKGDTNIVTIFTKDKQKYEYPQLSKEEVAIKILEEIQAFIERNKLV
ncbi:bifunctional phosphopantothenoylcysteine decarboxylase/phosphopantothenate--cysteine ligase CoaBC [Bacillus solitudinis]|uniref:bifunctional phosphopantothenoylcysteine decarboxylase/phosphopantothenate--cysteine ligase CoaBC n=1 Tax=Bacillus solitudinis TaxID=2014074 RepID=UPI000C242F72|nr:bifunctional phosphopantothenoylcysteine decarboxylase/phosphopantothenate--cysteine ligase CoaBC [Bacillus solitudinis]